MGVAMVEGANTLTLLLYIGLMEVRIPVPVMKDKKVLIIGKTLHYTVPYGAPYLDGRPVM